MPIAKSPHIKENKGQQDPGKVHGHNLLFLVTYGSQRCTFSPLMPCCLYSQVQLPWLLLSAYQSQGRFKHITAAMINYTTHRNGRIHLLLFHEIPTYSALRTCCHKTLPLFYYILSSSPSRSCTLASHPCSSII